MTMDYDVWLQSCECTVLLCTQSGFVSRLCSGTARMMAAGVTSRIQDLHAAYMHMMLCLLGWDGVQDALMQSASVRKPLGTCGTGPGWCRSTCVCQCSMSCQRARTCLQHMSALARHKARLLVQGHHVQASEADTQGTTLMLHVWCFDFAGC